MSSINKKNKMNNNKIKLTFHPAEFGAKMPIPLAEQSVKAGFPSPAQDYMEGEIDLNDILVRHREATFYVRVSGDSMQDAGILDGDLAIVDRQIEPSTATSSSPSWMANSPSSNSRWMRAEPSAGSFHGTRTSPLSG